MIMYSLLREHMCSVDISMDVYVHIQHFFGEEHHHAVI